MPPCSKLRKAVCTDTVGCDWVVAKGCKSTSQPKAKQPMPTITYIINDNDVRAVISQVHPDSNITAGGKDFVKKTITDLVKDAFGKTSVEVFDAGEVRKLCLLGKNTKPGLLSDKYARRVVQKKERSMITVPRGPIKNTADKIVTFDEDGKAYLNGMIQFIMMTLLELGGDIAISLKKKRITDAHLIQVVKQHEGYLHAP